MIITKGIKAELKPNLRQKEWLDQQFGNIRFIWNHYLDLLKKQYQVARIYKLSKKIVPKPLRFPKKYDLYNDLKFLKKKYKWLKYSDSRSLQCELGTLYQTYQHLFKGLCGVPKFKSRKHYRQSYTTSSVPSQTKITAKHAVKLAKLGHVKAYLSSKLTGRIKQVTITLEPTGKYYASFTVQCESQPLQKTGRWIGIDVGLDHLLNLSNGDKYNFKRYDKALASKHHYWKKRSERRRRLAKKSIAQQKHYQKKSALPNYHVKSLNEYHNYVKARCLAAKYSAKIKNQMRNYLQWLTTYLVRRYDIICIEDLKVSQMIHNHHLARSITTAAWRTFRIMLQYKCEWYGKVLIVVDKDYTSQVCHHCHTWCGKKDLGTRNFYCQNKKCPYHNKKLDRDINAAKNILALGLGQVAPKTLQPLKRT